MQDANNMFRFSSGELIHAINTVREISYLY